MSSSSAMAGTSSGFSVLSGIFSLVGAQQQAKGQRAMARLAVDEAEAEALRYKAEADYFQSSQKLKFLKSGVAVEGSVLSVLADTALRAQENVNAIRASGRAKALQIKSGATATLNAGRSAFVAGTTDALKTGTQYGLFGAGPKPNAPAEGGPK